MEEGPRAEETTVSEGPAVHVEFMHFCSYAFFDERRNPCIIGIMGRTMYAHAFPLRQFTLCVAVGVQLPVGVETTITMELGRPGGKAERNWHITLNGPTKEFADQTIFLPFRTISLFFEKPQTIEVRLIVNEQTLAARQLTIMRGPAVIFAEASIAPPVADDPYRR